MRISRGITALFLLALAARAEAQSDVRRFTVAPRGGYMHFDRATSIAPSGFVGVEATYALTSFFTIGPTFTASRPTSRGQDYIASISVADTTFLFQVQQPLTVFDVGLAATLRSPVLLGRLAPYLVGSVGSYSVFMDPQVMRGPRSFSKMSAAFGGGLNLRVSNRAGILLEARDHIFSDFDRQRLNPTAPRFQNQRFIEDFPTPPASKTTMHNFAISLGFTYVPSLGDPAPGTEGAAATTGGGN